MKKLLSLTIILTISIINYVVGQTEPAEAIKAYQTIEQRGEVYFRFDIPSFIKNNPILKKVSIDKLENGKVYAYANKNEFQSVIGNISGLEILTPPSLQKEVSMANSFKQAQSWDYYPTYSQYIALMDSFANAHPAICQKFNFGTTTNGRELLILKISDNVGIKEAEPEFLYISSIHGDELTGAILMLRLIDYLLTNYGTDPEVTNLVDNIEIWINPLSNPDGTYFLSNNNVNGAIRYNGNFIDLNRNFPDPENGNHPDGNSWQPETQAWMSFMEQHNFVMAATFHGGSELMNYPWDTKSTLHPDDNWFQFVSREFADTIHVYNSSGYFTDMINGITNGYAWYEIDGGRQDYATYFRHCREITIEISSDKNPDSSEMPDFWNWTNRSILNYLEQVTYGIRGIVTDSLTGDPLKAFVEVLNHDSDSSQVYSDSTNGNYHRLIKAGTYNLRFSSPGYIPKTINGITATDLQATILDVQLVKQSSGLNKPYFDNNLVFFPNPVAKNSSLQIKNLPETQTSYTIIDNTGRIIASGQCCTSQINIPAIEPGLYTIFISQDKTSFSEKLVIY